MDVTIKANESVPGDVAWLLRHCRLSRSQIRGNAARWHPGWSHRGRDQAGQVDLVAQSLREPRDRSLGVVASPVKPPVDRRLDSPSKGLEQREGHERGRCDSHRLALGDIDEDGLKGDDHSREHDHEVPVTNAQETVRAISRSIS